MAFGTANEVSESLLTSLYFSEAKSITKVLFTCEDVIKHKKLVSEKHAEKYETTVKNEIEKKGLHSSYIQSQYYCNFHMTNEKFISLEKLKDNNILIGSIETDIKHYTDKNIYRVGAIDPAISHDRAIFCYGTADITDRNSIITNLKDIVIMKEKNELTNSKIIAKRLADECLANNLDILVIDNTSTQIHQSFEVANYFLEHGIKTQVIPQSFAGQEKMKMLAFMENSFYKQMAILPSLEYKNSHKGYKLLLEELFYLRKEKRQSGYTWSAPKGEEYTDDAVMAYLMFNYAMYDFLNRIKEREMITISTLKYFPTLRKYPTGEQQKSNNLSTWTEMW